MRVKAGIFSLTAAASPADDGSYLRWHLLDHMPEQYLVADPVEETFDDFVTLGRTLRDNGRFPVARPSLQVAGPTNGCSGCTPSTIRRCSQRQAQPARGRSVPAPDGATSPADGEPITITVIYLDDDPLTCTAALAPLIEERWRTTAVRPVFAGPLRSMIKWEAWP